MYIQIYNHVLLQLHNLYNLYNVCPWQKLCTTIQELGQNTVAHFPRVIPASPADGVVEMAPIFLACLSLGGTLAFHVSCGYSDKGTSILSLLSLSRVSTNGTLGGIKEPWTS